jgi:hypothetical protein
MERVNKEITISENVVRTIFKLYIKDVYGATKVHINT